MSFHLSIYDKTSGKRYDDVEIESDDPLTVEDLITALLTEIHPELNLSDDDNLEPEKFSFIRMNGWALSYEDSAPSELLQRTTIIDLTKHHNLVLSKPSPIPPGLLIEKMQETTDIDNCPWEDCSAVRFDKSTPISFCKHCYRVLYFCEQCETPNTVIALYCRNCGSSLTGKMSKLTTFYKRFILPLGADETNVIRRGSPLPLDNVSSIVALTPIFGKLLITLRDSLILVSEDRRGQISRKLSELLPQFQNETFLGEVFLTDSSVYLATTRNLLKLDFCDLVSEEGIRPERYSFNSSIQSVILLGETDFVVLTDAGIHVCNTAFELDPRSPYRLNAEGRASSPVQRLIKISESEFLGLTSGTIFHCRYEQGELSWDLYSTESDLTQEELLYVEQTLFYLKEGRLYAKVLGSQMADKELSQKRNYHRLHHCGCAGINGVVAEYDGGWDFYSSFLPYPIDGHRSKSGIMLDTSVSSSIFGTYYLCAVLGDKPTESRVNLFDLAQGGLRIRQVLENYEHIYEMTLYLNSLYVLASKLNRKELTEYVLEYSVEEE